MIINYRRIILQNREKSTMRESRRQPGMIFTILLDFFNSHPRRCLLLMDFSFVLKFLVFNFDTVIIRRTESQTYNPSSFVTSCTTLVDDFHNFVAYTIFGRFI